MVKKKCNLAERKELPGSHMGGGGGVRGWGETHTQKFTCDAHGFSKTDTDYLSPTPPLNETIKINRNSELLTLDFLASASAFTHGLLQRF